MVRPGPKLLGHTRELRTTISPDLDETLARLVELSGTSKATLIRQALTEKFAAMGVLYPDVVDAFHPTKTSGRSTNVHIKRKIRRNQ